jgi:hypothetical protein
MKSLLLNLAAVHRFDKPAWQAVWWIGRLLCIVKRMVCSTRRLPIATFADMESPASQRNADTMAGDRFRGHLFAQ